MAQILEIQLVNNLTVNFRQVTNEVRQSNEYNAYFRTARLGPLNVPKSLQHYFMKPGEKRNGSQQIDQKCLELALAVPVPAPYGYRQPSTLFLFGYGHDGAKSTIRVKDEEGAGLLEALHSKHPNGIQLRVRLSDFKLSNAPHMIFDFALDTGMTSMKQNPANGLFEADASFVPVEANHRNFAAYWQTANITAKVTITVSVPRDFDDSSLAVNIPDKLTIVKKILKEEIGFDVVIVTKNGVHVKCHKSFLFAQSAVLETMFCSGMKEAKTGTVEILDMEEASVRAFLAYLYYWDVEQPVKSSLVAFELLNAGHKYDVASLEENMRNILLKKRDKWYDVDVAMRLFLFSRNLPDGDQLKMKAIGVLKSKFSVLETSKCYQDLFKKNPKAAMELCKYAFST